METKLLLRTLALLYLAITPHLNAQKTNTDFVYAGVGIKFIMEMARVDYTILFRADGTFCEDLEENDWQTRVNGYYTENSKYIIMEYLDKTIENDTIFFDGDKLMAEYYGTQVIRMKPPNKVPAGYYNFSSSASSGGMGTGMAYVGTQHYEGLNFYDNGTFNKSTSGAVIVSGSNVAGGTASDKTQKGKYTIKNGLLTLLYDDGRVEKNSFFYDSSEVNNFMVVIGGDIYFYGEKEEETSLNSSVNKDEVSDKKATVTTKKEKALSLLQKTKQKHGGKYIDALKSVKTEFTISGISFRALMDVEKSFIRLESLDASFPYIEQLEGNTGWIYQNGFNQQMPKERMEELKLIFVSGIFGLQNRVLEKAVVKEIKETDETNIIVLEVGKNIIGYVLNNETFKMLATFSLKNGQEEMTTMSNFKQVENLLLPFIELTETPDGNVDVTYGGYNINPVLTSKDWAKPK